MNPDDRFDDNASTPMERLGLVGIFDPAVQEALRNHEAWKAEHPDGEDMETDLLEIEFPNPPDPAIEAAWKAKLAEKTRVFHEERRISKEATKRRLSSFFKWARCRCCGHFLFVHSFIVADCILCRDTNPPCRGITGGFPGG